MMEEASLEYAVAPDSKILARYYEAPGAQMVERLIKLAQFSLDTAPTPRPTTNKRRKLNAPTPTSGQHYVQLQMRNAYQRGLPQYACRHGRGGYNKNFCSPVPDNRPPQASGSDFLEQRRAGQLSRSQDQ